VWLGALAMLLLVSHGFWNQTISGRNVGPVMVLGVAWFGWAVLTYAVRQKLFGVEAPAANLKFKPDAPVVVEKSPAGNWEPVLDDPDLEVPFKEPDAERVTVTQALIDRHRQSMGYAESDPAWVDIRARLIVAYAGQSVEGFKAQVSRLLGVGAFRFLVEIGDAEQGLMAGEVVSQRLGDSFVLVAVYDSPMRYVIYEARG
jgi:hypothetical protein